MTIYKFSVGLVLALAMVAVLTFSALVFSARDFRIGLAQVAPATNGLLSFEKLREADAASSRWGQRRRAANWPSLTGGRRARRPIARRRRQRNPRRHRRRRRGA